MATRIVTMLGVDTARMIIHTTGNGSIVLCEFELLDDAGGTFRVSVDPATILGAGLATFRADLASLYNSAVAAAGFA